MNSEQFSKVMKLATRLVDSIEGENTRKRDEWSKVMEEMARRKKALDKLGAVIGVDVDEATEVVDLDELFKDSEDEDEDSSD